MPNLRVRTFKGHTYRPEGTSHHWPLFSIAFYMYEPFPHASHPC